MQLPQPPTTANFNQIENQDRTQLTSGGTPGQGEFKPGDLVDGTYEIISMIGSGGMGNVYRARHSIMKQEYALKTLSADQVNEVAWRRFQNEAQAIARMSHANIVGIYNLGLHDGRLPFYVMDLLKGQTLLDVLRNSGPLPLKQALAIFSEVGAGIGYAHKKGIVHRDIKPANIVIVDTQDSSGSRIKIVDFGIAKLSGIKDQRNQELTSVGEICGSPFYMSPEQCNGGRVDTRSDIYSFGCTLFELLTGEPPFKGRNALETMLMHQNDPAPSLRSVSGQVFPAMLEHAMATMLAKAPMDRYQNMELIVHDFGVILEGRDQAISPFVTQANKRVEIDDKDFVGRRSGQYSTTHLDAIESEPETPRRPLMTAAVIGVALTVGIGLIASAGALYAFMTPKSTQKSATHFIKATAIPKPGEKASANSVNDELTENASDNAAILNGMGKAIPAMTDQTPGASLNDIKPFAHDTVENGQKVRVFQFPTDFSIGVITMEHGGSVSCADRISFPAEGRLILEPVPSLAQYPQYIKRFRTGDLTGVALGPPSDSPDVLKALTALKNIKTVKLLACSRLDDDAVPILAKFDSVEELQVNDCGITGRGLAKLPYLKKLKMLVNNAGTDEEVLLNALAGSEAITCLELCQVSLSDECFKDISTLKNLKTLYIEGTEVSDENLKELAKLPNLRTLSAPHCNFKPSQVSILKTFPRLRTLHIHSKQTNEYVMNQFRRGLPGVSVQ